MSDEINEQSTPETGPEDTSPETGSAPEPGAAVESAADVAAAAAKLAAEAAMNDPAPTDSEAQAVEAAADTVRETRAEAEAAVGATDATTPESDGPTAFNLETFDAPGAGAAPGAMSLLDDVNLDVKIELGRTRMFVEDVLKLADGAVVELDKLAGDPVDIYVNNRHVARGEVLVLNDNFCVRVSEILDPSVDDPKK